jgi:hypothetical protein
MEAAQLIKGRKLQVPPQEAEAIFLVQVQRILDEGDHDSADRYLWTHAVLAVRELRDLREQEERRRKSFINVVYKFKRLASG